MVDLKASTLVIHPETGGAVFLERGTALPGWAAALVTNPEVVDQVEAAPEVDPAKDDGGDPEVTPEVVAPELVIPVVTTPEVVDQVERPKSNDSKGKWAAFAASLGIEVSEDAALTDIKELVRAAEATKPEGN